MLNICFGNHEDRVRDIANAVDRTLFRVKFDDLDLIDYEDFDCVVPLHISDYKALQIHNAYFGTKFWLPNPNLVDLCDDKLSLNYLLLGGRFAKFVPPLRESTSGQFPYVVKKRHDLWGQNTFIVRNSEDERAMATILQSPEYFCQTYIPGPEEYALHMLMVDGEVAYAQTVKHNMGQECYVFGKSTQSKRSTYLSESEHIAAFAPMLMALNYSGTCCIDYKIDNGVPKLLEINPRYGGSLTGDINRYLEAYLCSLGVVDKIVLRSGKVPKTVRVRRFLESLNANIASRNL
jgi:glutathione synthase/RimK-type ligase-like ATP-grasp enzyme